MTLNRLQMFKVGLRTMCPFGGRHCRPQGQYLIASQMVTSYHCSRLPHTFPSPDNADFVQGSLTKLLSNRCVRAVTEVPHICSPLSVVANRAGTKRLVLNLHFLNQFLLKDKFKYENIRLAMLIFQRDDFMFSFDLKSVYHHVDIHQEHWKYLGFAWSNGASVQHYVFCVLAWLQPVISLPNLCVPWLNIGEAKA